MKEKVELSSLNVARLSLEDAGGLFNRTANIAIPFKSYLGDMVNAALADLIKSSDELMEQINRIDKSQLTDKVLAARKTNDDTFSEIKRIVVFMITSRDADKKTAAQSLEFFFTSYWDVSKKSLATQIELTTEMVSKFRADSKLMDNAKIIGMDMQMVELETSNNNLIVLFDARNQEISERKASGSVLRPVASESYKLFCTAVEHAVNFTPNDSLITLFNGMNELRKRYHALIPNKKDKTEKEPLK